MTTFTVTSNADSGDGTLRNDLAAAQNGDTINFNLTPGSSTIDLSSTLVIGKNVAIEGSPGVVIDGQSVNTDFTVDQGVTASIDRLTIQNGYGYRAGGIYDRGTLTLSNSTIATDTSYGGPNQRGDGSPGVSTAGGIYVAGGASLDLVAQTNAFMSNSASGQQGAMGPPSTNGFFQYRGGSQGQGGTQSTGMSQAATSGGIGTGQHGGAGGAAATYSGHKTLTYAQPGSPGQAYMVDGKTYMGPGGGGGGGNAFADYGGAGTVNIVCYASGTRIRTGRGEIEVGHLVIGDLVVTTSGAHRPIRWLGHRTVDCRRHPHPHDVMPVRIAAHAFGPNRPSRDLRVSPGHASCIDVAGEVLIPAGALVNETTIAQVEVDEVTYWHVELDSHDILLAENLPAESYLEMGNRGFFVEGEVVALGASPDVDPSRRTHADFCRPYFENGPIVASVRERLAASALASGWRLAEAV